MQGFESLMPFRVREVLLVSSLYDSFTFQEDGQDSDPVLSDYAELKLRYAPRVKRVSTGAEALDELNEHGRYDLILVTPQLGAISAVEFAEEVRSEFGAIPMVLLGYDAASIDSLLACTDCNPFDHTCVWNGDSRLMLATIKLIEDQANFAHDAARVGVQAVLLVEDSVNFLSIYLPILFTEMMAQSQHVITEGANLAHKLLRLRARPKVILAKDLETAQKLFAEHHEHLIGVISDASFPATPEGKPVDDSGFNFVRTVKEKYPDMPVLVQSSEDKNRDWTEALEASFLNKNTPRLHRAMRRFMLDNFGFGPFVFRAPDGSEVGIAEDTHEMEEVVRSLPVESLLYHAVRNEFSLWLRARTEFQLAERIANRRVSDFAHAEDLRSYLLAELLEARRESQRGAIADFDRRNFDNTASISRIGHGSLGGKARGLAFLNYMLSMYRIGEKYENVRITVPPAVVITTGQFDRFLLENNLGVEAVAGLDDDAVKELFVSASLPRNLVEDLRAYLKVVRKPIAVRSSSLLEDSHNQPFAGIYETLMLPNERDNLDDRLRALCHAVKLVYASTYSQRSCTYIEATPYHHEEEKMGVIVQELFGRQRASNSCYPTLAGVACSVNHYPHGPVKPDDGVCQIALGLGATVVGGSGGLRFCPRHPRHLPQFSLVDDILKNAQRDFYGLKNDCSCDICVPEVCMQPTRFPIQQADQDGVLAKVGSVYSPENGTIYDGTARPGVRIVSFASILKHGIFPLPELIDEVLQTGAWGMGTAVEIEFAADLDGPRDEPRELALLQMRPMVVSQEQVHVDLSDFETAQTVVTSQRALGNGRTSDIFDVLFVDPENFERSESIKTASSVGEFNAALKSDDRPYLLVGPGRWGSSDSWLGIPVEWGQIAGAKTVIECGFEDFKVEPSEGSHFFHNMTSFGVGYMTVNPEHGDGSLDFDWLRKQDVVREGANGLKWLRLAQPLSILIDGRTSHGVVVKG